MTENPNNSSMDEQQKAEQAVQMFEKQDFSTIGFWHRMSYSVKLIIWILGIKTHQGLKRIFDLVVSVTALIILSPVFLITAILIKLDSPGPVFFQQTRVGKWGRLFGVYKFRSMYIDAERRKQELMKLNEADGPVFKMKQDPRVTRVGRVIRKISVDELPQLINILKGEMTLVGPRPPLPKEVDKYKYSQRKRLDVVQGITGLQQVSGRSDLNFEQWVAYDIEYIEKQSFWFDIKILLKTIPAVLTGKGAY